MNSQLTGRIRPRPTWFGLVLMEVEEERTESRRRVRGDLLRPPEKYTYTYWRRARPEDVVKIFDPRETL